MSEVQSILDKIQKQIEDADLKETFSEQWEILEIKDGVAVVIWLNKAMFNEIVLFENWTKWLVLDLLKDQVWVLILGRDSGLKTWQIVKTTWKIFSVSVWESYIGRVVDGIWNPIDGKWEIKSNEFYPVEKIAPRVMDRKWVHEPVQTGIKSIDNMIPVGRWQRELIIWDRQTGKTAIAIDTILNQKSENMYCVYVAIWQKDSKVARIVQTLREKWAMDYTIVVNAPANSPSVMQYMAPYIGCSLAEYFMNNGKHALIIYDDLSKHAVAYREMSLLLKRPPGREAYPGDVFYLHSRLLERAAKLNDAQGAGSLTALPIIETQAGDVSAYIPTNVISITDGQIFLESDLFNAGIRPAVNVWLSVSRVWWNAQTKIMKKISWPLRLELASFRELQAFAQFGSDLDPATKKKLDRWTRMVEMLKQPVNSPVHFAKQSVLVFAGINGYLDNIRVDQVAEFEQVLYDKLDTSYKSLFDKIQKEKSLTDEIKSEIEICISEVQKEVLNEND